MATSLEQQARSQALGGAGSRRQVLLKSGSGFEAGVVDAVRLQAYYPPTRELWDVTDFLVSLAMADDQTVAATSATLTFDNGDGQVGLALNRPGMIYIFETRAAGRAFKERKRLVAFETEATDLNQGQLTVDAYDHLIYPHSITIDASYVADKKHPKGWYPHEIAADLCRKARIPVAGLVKGKYRIKRFVVKEASILDLIVKAYYIDQRKTGNYYYVVSDKGKLRVRRSKKRTELLALDERYNVRSGSFRRSLPDNFAQTVLPKGGVTNPTTGKRDASKTKAKSAKSAREKKVSPNSKEGKRLASAALLGNLTYSARPLSVDDSDWSSANAQLLSNRLGRAAKVLTLEVDGNIMLEVGDRVFVRLTTAAGRPMRKEVFVTSVSHSIAAGEFVSQVMCRWRELDVAIKADLQDMEKAGADSSTSSTGATKGKYSKADLVELATAHGFPDPNLAAAVAMAESGGDPNARNHNTNGSVDRGLWQINSVHKQYDAAKLFSADYNATAAYAIGGGGTNWQPWVTYNTGAYKKYL